jgi:hypothetical protein
MRREPRRADLPAHNGTHVYDLIVAIVAIVAGVLAALVLTVVRQTRWARAHGSS